jgi:hypothetical protein
MALAGEKGRQGIPTLLAWRRTGEAARKMVKQGRIPYHSCTEKFDRQNIQCAIGNIAVK